MSCADSQVVVQVLLWAMWTPGWLYRFYGGLCGLSGGHCIVAGDCTGSVEGCAILSGGQCWLSGSCAGTVLGCVDSEVVVQALWLAVWTLWWATPTLR